MKREDQVVVIVWITILAMVCVGIVYAAKFVSWIGNQPQILAAIIAAAAVVIGGILTHYLTQRREQENEQKRALMTNYIEILDRIDKLIRERGKNDNFSNIHLQTWVVGSPAVVEKSKALLKAARGEPKTDLRAALEGLVKAMRKDVGLQDEIATSLEGVYSYTATGIPQAVTERQE
jgi:DNA topoisomerase VI subunit B